MLTELRFSHKIVLMPALAAVAFLLIFLTHFLVGARTQELLTEIDRGYAPAFELSRDLEEILTEVQRGLQDAVAIRDFDVVDDQDRLAEAFVARVGEGHRIATLDPEEMARLGGRFQAYYGLARNVTARMIRDETGIKLARDLERMRVEFNAIDRQLLEFTRHQRRQMQAAFATAQRNQRLSMAATSAVTVLFLLLLGVLSRFVVSSLKGQLAKAVELADALARDDDHVGEIEITSHDEIGHLLERMRRMVARVRQRTVELRHEVGERARAEEALRESEERYALAARGANDGLWDWDLRIDRVHLSPRWLEMLGFGGDELGDDPEAWLGRLHPDDRPAVEQRLQAHREGVLPHFESEHRIRHRDGSYVWVLARGLAVRDDTGVCYRMAGSQSDITERKRTEQQLVHDAFHDGLTGLPNRALFLDRLSQAIRVAAKRRDAGFAVLFLDLDRFKVINDSLGHLVGDRLLVEMARRLETCVRPEDTVARLGGDEFALLLDDLVDPSMALRVAERSQREAARSWSIDGHEGVTTVSIGIALSESGYEKPEDVLRDADIAMYRAKGLGKARHAVFDTEMHARSMAVLELEMDLRRAIDRRELSVYYQPIVSLVDGCLQGFEALVRWHHPERGLILPEEFVPLAEETGLIVPIGDIVLASVARELASWRRLYPEFPVHVTVNLSARQLAQTELVSEIARTLAEADLESPMLRFEITETALMEDHDAMARTLTQLRELDVRVYLDDFGTGYSSLSYLQRLPIDFLKIDRSFVQSLGEESGDGAMVRAIVTLARHLEMDVVAEGVETDYQATVLREIGCQQAQGFLFSPPLPCEHAVELVAGRHRYSLPAGGGGSGPSSAGIRRTPTS